MFKIWLIIKREYLSRVKKKSFIITTILAPLGIVFIFAIQIMVMLLGSESKTIVIKDESGLIVKEGRVDMKDGQGIYFKSSDKSLEVLKSNYKADGYNGVLHIPKADYTNEGRFRYPIEYTSDQPIGLMARDAVERKLQNEIRNMRLTAGNIDQKFLKKLDGLKVVLDEKSDDGESVNSGLAFGFGMVIGMIMYMVIIIYGNMVMKGVLEEKTNRIVEVILSSVKPFQLMLGKIIGIGGVGLTQFVIWIFLVTIIYTGMGLLVAGYIPIDSIASPVDMPSGSVDNFDMEEVEAMMQMVSEKINEYNIPLLLGMFLFYFLGGYVLYAALYAAVGSAIGEDSNESNALVFIVTIPIMIAIFILLVAVNQPNSSLTFWSTLIPFFSPIIMPAMIPFSPPWWQIALSMVLLVLGVIVAVWIAARIYRTGILMHGKKISIKEIAKWMIRGS